MRWILALVLGVGLVASAAAEVPQQLHYNGYLTNAVGEAVDCPDPIQCDTPVDLNFRFYSTAEDGEPLWEESFNGVPVFSGSFHTILGTNNPVSAELLDGPVWLGVTVNENAEMSPRQKITASAYALRAGTSEQAEVAVNATQLGGVDAAEYTPQAILAPVATQGLPDDLTDGDDDTLATMPCGTGMIVKATGTGGWVCNVDETGDSDTTLTEEQVDNYVADNGYAAQADLATAQTALNDLQLALSELQSSTGADTSAVQAQIVLLETSLASAESNLTTLQTDLANELATRQAADDAEAVTRGAKDIELEAALASEETLRSDGDLVLQGHINTVESGVVALDASLDPIAKAGLPADLADGDDDTQLTEAEVDAYVANNNYAQISETVAALVCTSGELQRFDGSDWTCTSDVFVDATGKVGIGITNPTQTLEVAGGAKISEVLEVVGGVHLGNPSIAPVGTLRWTGTELHINTPVGWQIVVMVLTEAAQCEHDGGSWEISQEVCYFPGSECFTGWTPKNNFSTTLAKSCSYQWCCGGWCTATIGPSCITTSHTRTNQSTENCMYCTQSNNGTQASCSAHVTEKGCSQD